MLDTTILAQSGPARNNIKPAVWGEYQLRQNPTLYSAVCNCSDGAIMGTIQYDRGIGYYFDPAMTADKEYVPAFDNWADYIAADVDALNADPADQIATEAA